MCTCFCATMQLWSAHSCELRRHFMTSPNQGVGIDFGTTNCAVAIASSTGVRMARFGQNTLETFRSVLYFDAERSRTRARKRPLAGPFAIDAYLAREEPGRLIQSLKSFLASALFTETWVGSNRYSVEDLTASLVQALRKEAEEQLGDLGTRVVAGRPVRFVGSDTEEDEALALERLDQAFRRAGFEQITFEFEPVGAAYFYESRLDHDELIVIADFGGGTSDFSLLRVGPGVRSRGKEQREILATVGVPIAGDSFDAKIVRHVVSPLLGLGTSYRSVDKILPVPSSIYLKLEKWHHLSFLRASDTMRMLRSLQVQALEPEKIEGLIHMVENDVGFNLHRSVQRAKYELSIQDRAMFEFTDSFVSIRQPVTRAEFESWIAGELAHIAECVETLLRQASVTSKRIDRVFLTGGTSLVPAVRRIFEERFGAARLSAGDEFTSVASGLALRAMDLNGVVC